MESRLIDAEELLTLVYSRSISVFQNGIEHFYNGKKKGLSKRTIEKWRSLTEIPCNKNLDKIAEIAKHKKTIEALTLSEVLLCINLSSDSVLKGNGKRVFTLMALSDDECLYSKSGNLYDYLVEKCKQPPKSDYEKNGTKVFHYIPGRSVTVDMLVEAGKKYGYKKRGIEEGLNNLVDKGLVERIEYKNVFLYRLSYSGIKQFCNK